LVQTVCGCVLNAFLKGAGNAAPTAPLSSFEKLQLLNARARYTGRHGFGIQITALHQQKFSKPHQPFPLLRQSADFAKSVCHLGSTCTWIYMVVIEVACALFADAVGPALLWKLGLFGLFEQLQKR